jgi:hypothetical protein
MSIQRAMALSVLTGLIQQRARELSALARDTEKCRSLEERIRNRRHRLLEIENQIRDAKIKSDDIPLPGRGIPNARSMDVLRVWSALYEALVANPEPEGLLHHKACNAIRRAVPGIADSTIRSHLHRLKGKGYIAKDAGRWQLLVSERNAGGEQS